MVDSLAGDRKGGVLVHCQAEEKQCQLPFPGGHPPCTSVAEVFCFVFLFGGGCREVPKVLQLPSLFPGELSPA